MREIEDMNPWQNFTDKCAEFGLTIQQANELGRLADEAMRPTNQRLERVIAWGKAWREWAIEAKEDGDESGYRFMEDGPCPGMPDREPPCQDE